MNTRGNVFEDRPDDGSGIIVKCDKMIGTAVIKRMQLKKKRREKPTFCTHCVYLNIGFSLLFFN